MRSTVDERFSMYVQRHRAAALATATRMLGDADQAEDIVQDASTRIYQEGVPMLEEDFRDLLMYRVRRLAKNFKARERRRQLRREALVETSARSLPEATAVEEAELRHLDAETAARALATLPPMQRDCFALIVLEDHSSEEVARLYGINGVTARQHAARARAALAKRLGALDRVTHGVLT